MNGNLATEVGTERAVGLLLVEDNPGDARLVREMLQEAWLSELGVEHVTSIAEAREFLVDHGVGCVLLDLTLPDASGVEAITGIRTSDPEVPIVVLTGLDDETVAEEAARGGAQDYLIKGRVDAELLSRTIRYAIDRKRSELEMAHELMHDALTGLPNRTLFADRLRVALGRSQRTDGAVAVFLLDIDNLKLVNQSFGQFAGDELLFEVGDRLLQSVRPGDTVARAGNDEFLVLCEALADNEQALALADRLADAVTADPLDLDGEEFFLHLSVGIAVESKEADPEDLLRDAETALFRAKARGGSCCELFDSAMRERAVRRLAVQNDLHRALERDELILHYQPQVELWGERIVGVEALARWEHPSRGLVPPNEFIGVAEESGQIEQLGAAMIERACRQLVQWDRSLAGRAPAHVAVNVSARQLGGDALIEAVKESIERSGLEPGRLCLEVTETAAMEDARRTEDALASLKSLGVVLAIDDFGTGYSSLAYLDRFPVDLLKIDRAFVSGMDADARKRRLVSAILGLASGLGLRAVAEGVETAGELRELRALRCALAQGYHFGRPMGAGDMAARLSRAA